jgi:RNA polymerase sigma factor (TIGR02999 family)
MIRAMSEVTVILAAIELGDAHAASQLLPLVYDELRRLVAQKLAHEKPGHKLEATALVHEAYLRLVGTQRRSSSGPAWDGRGHFFAAAAEAMRRIRVENAPTGSFLTVAQFSNGPIHTLIYRHSHIFLLQSKIGKV